MIIFSKPRGKSPAWRKSCTDHRNGNRPPRILQLAAVDFALKNLLLPLLESLRDEGFEVEAAAADLGSAAEQIKSRGFPFHRIDIERNLTLSNIIRAFFSIYWLLRKQRFEIVHLHTPLAAFIGRFAARLAGVPHILYTAHGFYFHDRMKTLKRRFYELLEWTAGRLTTDFLFCQSIEDTDAAVEKGFLSPGKILHIGNGVNTERFKPDVSLSPIVRDELNIRRDAVVITFIGRIIREKGILDLAEAFLEIAERHPKGVLLVAGDCETAGDRDKTASAQIKQAAQSPRAPGRIVLLGYRNDPERILAASDIFVLPSYREGLPRSICEAMACGVPTVATRIRGCREEVLEGETGILVEPGDVRELSSALDDLITHRGKRIAMGERARLRAMRLFDEREVISRQINIYRNLIGIEIPYRRSHKAATSAEIPRSNVKESIPI